MPERSVYPPAIGTKATNIQSKNKKNHSQGRYVYGSINNVSVQEIYNQSRKGSLDTVVSDNNVEEGKRFDDEQTSFLSHSTNVELSYQGGRGVGRSTNNSSSVVDKEKHKKYTRVLMGSSLLGMLLLTVLLGLSLLSKDTTLQNAADKNIPILGSTKPSNGSTDDSNLISCLDESCSDFVSMLAQGWKNNANIETLSCLGSAVGNKTQAQNCLTAPATGSQAISNLKYCAMCNECIKPKNETAKAEACDAIKKKTGTNSEEKNPWTGSGIHLPNFNFTIPVGNNPLNSNSKVFMSSDKSKDENVPLDAPSTLSCFEDHCDDLMKMVAKGWSDNANLKLLTCLGSNALNGTAAKGCFKAPATSSEARTNLKNCGLCNSCLPAPDEKTKTKACADVPIN